MKSILIFTVLIATGSALSQEAYLIDYFGPDGTMVKLSLTNPSQETVIGPAMPFLGDVELIPEEALYALPLNGTEFYQVDTTTAVVTQIGTSTPPPGHMWTGLAYDMSTGNLYASSTDGSDSSAFFIIDRPSGTPTLIGSTGVAVSIVDIAVTTTGDMYGHDLPDSFYSIDKATGEVTYIGDTGFQGAGPWYGLDYCDLNDTMYMAAYNSISMTRSIRTVNLTTGFTTEVGEITRGAGGFATILPIPALNRTTWAGIKHSFRL